MTPKPPPPPPDPDAVTLNAAGRAWARAMEKRFPRPKRKKAASP